MSEQNKILTRRALEEVWNRGNFAVVDELVASDFIVHAPSADGEIRGPEGVKAFYAMLRTALRVGRHGRVVGLDLNPDMLKAAHVTAEQDGLLSTARDLFAECPIPGAQLGFLHLGGSLNERAWDDGAVGNRDARVAFGVNGMWEPDEPNADTFRQWVRDAWKRVRPFSTGRTYINFQTADEDEERIRATYGPNFHRLVEIKTRYDPDNLFRVNRNIRAQARVGKV